MNGRNCSNRSTSTEVEEALSSNDFFWGGGGVIISGIIF